MKNKALADSPLEGNWATGNLNPLFPRKTNCSTWVASAIIVVFPVTKDRLQFHFRYNSPEKSTVFDLSIPG